MRDLSVTRVRAQRWRCTVCGYTFRLYPQGITHRQQSLRLQGLSIYLWLLGSSLGGVADLLKDLGCPLSRTTILGNLQRAGTSARRAVRARVDELIDLLGLEAFREKYARELSTGSRRIVDLACVLAHEPRVLLLDEPSSGIAQKEAEALGPLLLRIRAMTGASLLVIEHDVPLLTSIVDRMVALDLGEVVRIGTAEEVVHDPRVVASYLGDSGAVVARSGPRDTGTRDT